MTNEEAIKILKVEHFGDSENMELAKHIAIKALEKQITKKPSKTDKARCIHCACVVERDERFCKNCGQALDWSDT